MSTTFHPSKKRIKKRRKKPHSIRNEWMLYFLSGIKDSENVGKCRKFSHMERKNKGSNGTQLA